MSHREDRSSLDERISIAVREGIDSHFSMRKNGESWRDYLVKVITPDRILMAALLVYQVGGQVQLFKLQVNGLVDREKNLIVQQENLNKQQTAQRELQVEQSRTIERLRTETDTLMEENAKFRQISVRLTDQIKGSMTRSEFNSTVRQQILPRLERIERQVRSNNEEE